MCLVLAACGGTSASSDGGTPQRYDATNASDAAVASNAPDAAVAALLLLGSNDGVEMFVHAPDGTPVELTHGPQGGYHLWLGVRAHGVTLLPLDDALRVKYTVTHAGTVVGQGTAYVGLEHINNNGVLEQTGLIMLLEWGVPLQTWRNEPVDVAVTLETERQRVLGAAAQQWLVTCCEDLTLSADAGAGDGGI